MNYKKYHRDSDYNKMESTFRNIFQKRFKLISKYIKNPKRVLDIGCSNGVFLDLFKNSETWGVEPSNNAKKANAKNHKIINLNFEKADLPKNYFDLVIMNHTLEHVKDAEIVLAKVYKLLKRDGVLFIDVPNAGGLGSKVLGNRWPYRLPNEHNYQFTKTSLSKMIEDRGFQVLYWESRSGIFEYSSPFLELKRKRFLLDLIFLPYSLIATILNMGDSMSFICEKN